MPEARLRLKLTNSIEIDRLNSFFDPLYLHTFLQVKKLGRGHSSEGDRFLDYWDGVQDSLDHEYLSSLIIAVYLDPNEPENLVESYTFNFAYTDVPGSSKKAVSMDVEEQM